MFAASQNLDAAGKVLNLFVDASIRDDAPFCVVKEKAFSLLDPGRFSLVANYMRNLAFDKTAFEWSCYGKLSHAFKRYGIQSLLRELAMTDVGLCIYYYTPTGQGPGRIRG
jgi:hypothetical protein